MRGEGARLTQIDFPFAIDGRGRTAHATAPDHIRDLLEQLLLTAPGERVNRPSLGAGLMELVHEPASEELAAATELLVQGAIQTWLGDLIEVGSADVSSNDGLFEVTVRYRVRSDGEERTEVFRRPT
jgi:Bacteriophage baseplate protein W